jgi:hypothetical protein
MTSLQRVAAGDYTSDLNSIEHVVASSDKHLEPPVKG